MKKHIVFDLDGTLIDTYQVLVDSWLKALKQLGYSRTQKDMDGVMGLETQTALAKLHVPAYLGFEEIWLQMYGLLCHQADWLPGAKEMLLELKQNPEYQLGVITSRSRQEINLFFSKFELEDLFEIMILADDTIKHKPDPDPCYAYMAEAGIIPEQMVYIGDRPTDCQCAQAAGVPFAYINWHLPTAEPSFDNIKDLLGWIQNHFAISE